MSPTSIVLRGRRGKERKAQSRLVLDSDNAVDNRSSLAGRDEPNGVSSEDRSGTGGD